MDIKDLKLQLVQQALQTDDAELLETALGVLQLGTRSASVSPSLSRQEPPGLQQGQPPRDEEAKQLQREIDQLFNLGD